MFGSLTQKFQKLLSGLRSPKSLTAENIADAVKQVRFALLDADVNYGVVASFTKRVQDKVIGDAIIKAVKPDQQFIQCVHEELVLLMGGVETPLDLNGKISILMVCGLQGSGKTTTCAKLAAYIAKTEKHKKI